jgi:hypothetical protein
MFRDLEELLSSLPETIGNNGAFYDLDIQRVRETWIIAYYCFDQPDLQALHLEENHSLYACADQMYIWVQQEGYLERPFEEEDC